MLLFITNIKYLYERSKQIHHKKKKKNATLQLEQSSLLLCVSAGGEALLEQSALAHSG